MARNQVKSAFGRISDGKGPTPRPLLGFTRKHHPDDAPLPHVTLKGISTTGIGIETDLGGRFKLCGVLESARKRFSQMIRLAPSRHCCYPATGLEVFVEVRRQTVYDPQRTMTPRWRPLGSQYGRDKAEQRKLGSSPPRCKRQLRDWLSCKFPF